MEIENIKATQSGKKPDSLTTLCVFSVLGVLLWTYRDVGMYVEYQSNIGWLNKNCFLAGIALNMIVLFSVFLMGLAKKKIGFYLYAVSQIVWLLFPFFRGSWGDTYFGLLVLPAIIPTILFIVLYARNLKYLS